MMNTLFLHALSAERRIYTAQLMVTGPPIAHAGSLMDIPSKSDPHPCLQDSECPSDNPMRLIAIPATGQGWRPSLRDMTNTIKLTSGRSIQANEGIVGIDANLRPTEGYDGPIDGAALTCDDCRDEDEVDLFSMADRVELADVMICRWSQYRELAVLRSCG